MAAPNRAPEIPNLLSLRPPGTSRGLGPRRRGGPPRKSGPSHAVYPSHSPTRLSSTISQAERDRLIQETDSDANVSRLSAVATGCLEDPFAGEFGACAPHSVPTIRQPIINRGTYVRTTAIDKLLLNLLEAKPNETIQVVSLGAGTDTRPFRYMTQDPSISSRILYHEFDFPEKSAEKFHYTQRSRHIRSLPSYQYTSPEDLEDEEGGEVEEESTGVLENLFRNNERSSRPINPATDQWGWWNATSGYIFHPCDLRDFEKRKEEARGAQFTNLRPDLSTVIVSECCLCYMTAEESDAVIKWFSDRIPTLGIILYEPCKPNDAFGQMMSENLASRGLSMPSIKVYDSLDAQCTRLRKAGFDMFQEGATIDWLWENWVQGQEHIRLDRILMVDEEEEWKLLAGHYLVCWAAKEAEEKDGAFEAWDNLEGEVERTIKTKGPIEEAKKMGDGRVVTEAVP